METIGGIEAIRMMKEVSKLPDGNFTIAFFRYNRTKDVASSKLQVRERCKVRAQLPQEKFHIPSDNFFLFQDEEGNPKTCYRALIRFVGFPPEYILTKVNWFKDV